MGLRKKISILILTGVLVLNIPLMAYAQVSKSVSLGANLTEQQKTDMLKYFNVTKENASVIEITNQDIREQLGMDTSKPIPPNSKSISSSFVEVLDKGNGIKVATNNLTEVTGTMLANALLTSGVEDAKVIASAPYPVTGTAALAGILKGFENATGTELSLEKKEVAREEISTTTQLGQTIGKDEAASIINSIKTEVIKEQPKTVNQIEKIVINVSNNYGIQLNEADTQRVTKLMSNVNDVGYDYKSMKDSLNKMADNINNTLKEAGKELKESGIIEKTWTNIKNFFSNLWTNIKEFFTPSDKEKVEDKEGTSPVIDKDSNEDLFFEEITPSSNEVNKDENDKKEIDKAKDNNAEGNKDNNAEGNKENNNTPSVNSNKAEQFDNGSGYENEKVNQTIEENTNNK